MLVAGFPNREQHVCCPLPSLPALPRVPRACPRATVGVGVGVGAGVGVGVVAGVGVGACAGVGAGASVRVGAGVGVRAAVGAGASGLSCGHWGCLSLRGISENIPTIAALSVLSSGSVPSHPALTRKRPRCLCPLQALPSVLWRC